MSDRAIRAACAWGLVALLVCGIAGAVPEPVELRLWNVPRRGSSSPTEIVRRRTFEAFCAANPDVKVRELAPLKIEGPAQEGNEFLAVAGGVAPDVFHLFGRKIGDYSRQGFLYPLNAHLDDFAGRHGRPYGGIGAPSKVWELCHEDGQVIAVPASYYSMALVCDSTALARAGLIGKRPRNWQELYEFARRMTYDPAKEPGARANDQMQFGLHHITGIYAGWHYLQYVWSAGGDVVRSYLPYGDELVPVPPPPVDWAALGVRISDAARYEARARGVREDLEARGISTSYSLSDLEWRLETDGPKAMEAIRFYRKLAHQPWLRNGEHEFDITPEMLRSRQAIDPRTGERFDLDDPDVAARVYYGVSAAAEQQAGNARGNVRYAMRIGGLGELSQFDPEEVALFPFPSREGEPPAAFIAGAYYGVNAAIVPRDEAGRRDVGAIRDAAWRYIEFVTGPAAERIAIDTYVEFGQEEFIRPALLREAGYSHLLDRIPEDRLALWENLRDHARVEPYCKGFTHVMTRELGLVIEAAFGDRIDPLTGTFSRDLDEEMAKVVANVNALILGRMPEAAVKRRSRAGWIVFTVMALALLLAAQLIVRMAMRAQRRLADSEGFGVGGDPARRRAYGWAFLVPAVLSIAIWNYWPLLRGLAMAFMDYRILGGSRYVGLRNFIEAVCEPKFWRYLLQAAQYMGMLVGVGFLVPILLAVLLTEIPRGRVLFRTIYYLPAVTTGVVTLFLWKHLIYDPSSQGVLNRLLAWLNSWPWWFATLFRTGGLIGLALLALGLLAHAGRGPGERAFRLLCAAVGGALALGLAWAVLRPLPEGWGAVAKAFVSPFAFEQQRFLRDPGSALFWVVVPTVWAGAGPGCLIYLAALKGIPEEQYEAADLDGAGFWGKLVHVAYPNLKALIIINFVGVVVAGFKASTNIFVMTGGGPEDATMTTGLYIWFNAFMFLNFGLATAMAWIMGALLIGFTLVQLRILHKLQFRSAATEDTRKEGMA